MWQGAVIMVQSAPNLPDMAAMAHALAEDAGEPSVEAIQAAALQGWHQTLPLGSMHCQWLLVKHVLTIAMHNCLIVLRIVV